MMHKIEADKHAQHTPAGLSACLRPPYPPAPAPASLSLSFTATPTFISDRLHFEEH